MGFSNYYLEQGEKVELIPPRGPSKERDTLVMPTSVKDALHDHLLEKVRSFMPLRRNCTTTDAQSRAAKYLGKYA